MAGAGDFDADGVDDLIIGVPSPPRIDAPVIAGKAYILSGAKLADFWDPVGGKGRIIGKSPATCFGERNVGAIKSVI